MLLAVDTASRSVSIALSDGQQILAEQTLYSNNQHTVQLTASIQDVLRGYTVADLTVLAIAQGPGSFSGLRVGFGVVKGLAMARGIPIIAVPTFDILAVATPSFAGDLVAVIQAGRRRILAGTYQWADNRWQKNKMPVNTTWQDLMQTITTPTVFNGEIDANGRALILQAGQSVLESGWQVRRAGFLAQLAWERYSSGQYPSDPNPIYLKEP